MLDRRLFLAQRLSALFMVPFVLTHLALMIWAIQGGLSVGEILGRTQGSGFWFAFYGLFVLAVSLHGAIGFRVILGEWAGLRGRLGALIGVVTGLALVLLGLSAVLAVT